MATTIPNLTNPTFKVFKLQRKQSRDKSSSLLNLTKTQKLPLHVKIQRQSSSTSIKLQSKPINHSKFFVERALRRDEIERRLNYSFIARASFAGVPKGHAPRPGLMQPPVRRDGYPDADVIVLNIGSMGSHLIPDPNRPAADEISNRFL